MSLSDAIARTLVDALEDGQSFREMFIAIHTVLCEAVGDELTWRRNMREYISFLQKQREELAKENADLRASASRLTDLLEASYNQQRQTQAALEELSGTKPCAFPCSILVCSNR
jgi:prefoldin subunit 5